MSPPAKPGAYLITESFGDDDDDLLRSQKAASGLHRRHQCLISHQLHYRRLTVPRHLLAAVLDEPIWGRVPEMLTNMGPGEAPHGAAFGPLASPIACKFKLLASSARRHRTPHTMQ
ncbi:hypothetical protein ebA6771 [Aromatoleum aromaticum EbN1]|uniref:Uncharacterized protein n=1 Tax=Aromatoleum aromaticum (strain DSM 19018 / LMG 30748 / EbN1) TaxID=76114 RepID=Q5NY66_AROAE|nr:hypothetical protein ebA6771 [Aromatoleum aromaticum EbN1]